MMLIAECGSGQMSALLLYEDVLFLAEISAAIEPKNRSPLN